MLAHHAQERLAVDVVAGKRAAMVAGDASRLRIGLAGHGRGDGRRVIAAGVAVVGQAARHQQRAEVGVAEPQRTEGVAVLLDRLGRVARIVDEDLLRRDQDAARGAERVGVELAIVLHERHQVQRREVAGRVVEEHVFRARVAGVDPRRVRAGVPLVDRGVELHAGVAAHPRAFGDRAHQIAGAIGVDHFAVGDRLGLPQAVVQHGAHEFIGDANGVVRVLEEHRSVRRAGERPVVAGIDQRPRLLLFFDLAIDELENVGMLGIENHHLRRAARLAARLDHAGKCVEALHERDRARCGAAAGEKLLRRSDRRQIAAGTRTEFEQHALGLGERQDRFHRVVDGIDEARRALRRLLETAVEPHRTVERRLLVDEQIFEIVAERLQRCIRGEILLLARPVGNRADDAADQLFDRVLAVRRADMAPEIFRDNNVRRLLRPGLGHLDAALLEDDGALFAADDRIAEFPFDLIERVNACGREKRGNSRPGEA